MGLFKKKRVFVWDQDYDMHSHILPGLDDGVSCLEEAVAMVGLMMAHGVRRFVFTPHVALPEPMNSAATIEPVFVQLCEALDHAGIKPESVHYAAEYRIDAYFMDLIASRALLWFTDPRRESDRTRKLVLVENNFVGESRWLDEALFFMQEVGYTPVLVHPERFPYYWSAPALVTEHFRRKGCLIQVNALSFTGFYGKEAQSAAWKIQDAGGVDFISGDLHSMEQAQILSAYRAKNKLS